MRKVAKFFIGKFVLLDENNLTELRKKVENTHFLRFLNAFLENFFGGKYLVVIRASF